MRKLSVIIPTYNEADNIRAAVQSVAFADEIIVVDSFSEDGTADLAQSLGCTVLQRAYTGPADQKNWVIPQAQHRSVLILDADERVTAELQKEIQSILKLPTIEKDAYWIGRSSFFMDKKVRYSGWQGDAVIRLIDRDKCRYNSKQVHEEIETQGIEVGKLSAKMEHYTFRNSAHFLEKIERYANWSAQDYFDRTPKVGWYHLYLKPFFRFFKHFIVQRGFLDGKVGFIISSINAWSVFLRYLKIKEMHQQKKP